VCAQAHGLLPEAGCSSQEKHTVGGLNRTKRASSGKGLGNRFLGQVKYIGNVFGDPVVSLHGVLL
jgi:hypothetical protein